MNNITTARITAQPSASAGESGRGLFQFCKIRGATWDCPALRCRFQTGPKPPSPLPRWSWAIGRRRRAAERRGVLLLLMLSLLVLFAVLGVTYVLVSMQFRRSAAVQPRLAQYAVDHRNQLDEVAMQIFRGSNNARSVLSIHSLLEDMYGNDAVASSSTSPTTASTANPPSGTGSMVTISSAAISMTTPINTSLAPTPNNLQIQLVDLTLNYPLPWPLAANTNYNAAAARFLANGGSGNLYSPYGPTTASPSGVTDAKGSAPSGFFNGCLLTFTTGPAAGQTTRIVGYDNGITNAASGTPTTTNSTGHTILRVMGFPGAQALVGGPGGANPTPAPPPWQFLINGRPFNGTGAGFNFMTNLIDALDGSTPSPHLFAFLPNPVTFANNNPATSTAAAYNVPGGVGGADEDYEHADFQNMLLGLPLDPRDVIGTVPAPNSYQTINYPPYPSLHRPELVSYWIYRASEGNDSSWSAFLADSTNGAGANLPLARQISLRPMGFAGSYEGNAVTVDHPNFTGSNPTTNANGFDPVNGPWDVDTDGDGVADSIWVDVGLPVHTAADGSMSKPLVAIRVLDMEGRLNVNAHGNSAQLETAYYNPTGAVANFASATVGTPTNPLIPNTVSSVNAQRPTVGSGYGTAEINLEPLYIQQNGTTTQYQYLLNGNAAAGATATYEGRHGESTTTSHAVAYDSTQMPSASTPPYAGYTLSNDVELTASALGLIKHWDFPFPGYPTMLTRYGSAPDLWGRNITALDISGTPLSPSMSAAPFQSTSNAAWTGGLGGQYDMLGNPYLLNLGRSAVRGAKATGATDNPFTPAELERLLRTYDSDSSSLAPRLAALLGVAPVSSQALAALRRQVTTDGYDLPSPALLTTSASLASLLQPPYSQTKPFPLPFNSSAADLLLAHLNQGGGGLSDSQLATAHPAWNNIPIQLQLLLPPELLSGQRFDINRAFGNGRDDDGDGVVDEPDEYHLGEPAWITPTGTTSPLNSGTSPFPNNAAANNAINLAIDWDGDGTIGTSDALMVRHLMARHLFVLAMMILDPQMNTDGSNGGPNNQQTAIQYDAGGPAGPNPTNANIYQVQYALAQWAINCVDFADRDSTMTPFEFDVNPLDGWSVDGVLGTADDANVLPGGGGGRGLVWGCERPELLITETLAWHDRRTEDLAAGGGQVGLGDTTNDFDQQVLPMPACFIELYNPWTTQYGNLNTTGGEKTNAPSANEVPGEFYYDPNNANAAYKPYTSYPNAQAPTGVVLNKVSDTTSHSPVWRMIFVNNGLSTGAAQLLAPSNPDPRILDPDDPVAANAATVAQYVDRIVYFVAPTGGTYPAGFPSNNCAVYYPGPSQPAPATLKPGRYAVAGSFGGDYSGNVYFSKLGRSLGNTGTAPDASPRTITLTPNASSQTNQVSIANSGQTTAEPGPLLAGSGSQDAQSAIAIALDYAVSPAVAAGARTFGISDPVAGYPNAALAIGNRNGAGEPQFPAANIQPQPLDATNGDPFMMKNQTYPGYRTVHLQRLANPQIAWNAVTNPYLTIDSAPVDVTAFNGVSATQDPGALSQNYAFCSTQRGDQYVGTKPPTLTQTNLLWARELCHTVGGVLSQPVGSVATSNFTPVLHHSLGYLNQMYGIASANANGVYSAAASTAYTSSNYAAPSAYLGMPTAPFPWLTWNNRPYATPLELALVPKCRSSRLLIDYSTTSGTSATIYNAQSGGIVLYPNVPAFGSATAPATGAATIPANSTIVPFFGHLLNFFDAGQSIPPNNTYPPGSLFRLFEYVQVPSRFVGTETILTPVGANYGVMNSAGAAPTPAPTLLSGDAPPGSPPGWCTGANSTNPVYTLASSPMGTYLRPPLNKVSEFRDPGHVNINTVQDPVVWQGVLNGAQYPALTAGGGVNVAGTVMTKAAGGTSAPLVTPGGGASVPVPTTSPSYFPNPFRSYSGAALANSIFGPNGGAPAAYPNAISLFNVPLRDIDVTLFRPSQIGTAPTAPNNPALFDSQAIVGGTALPYNDPTRSPTFRLQNISRMSNLLTTHSNVYAVWITVGNFQVTPWYGYPTAQGSPYPMSTTAAPLPIVYDTAHPDGLQLGQELGNDTGDIKRHRAFYIFDRTIPVGFERGVDHNVQNAIVLRRFIE